jgi:peroxiredoxin
MGGDVSKRGPVNTSLEALAGVLRDFNPSDVEADRLLSSWLRESKLAEGALNVNELAPDFLLPNANGRLVSSRSLRRTGPLIVTFFYGGWSPFCVTGLRILQGVIPNLCAAGASAVAITPETGDFPRKLKRDYRFDLEIVSDVDLGVSACFGLVFLLPAEVKRCLSQRGLDLSARHGCSFWMLPMPASYVVDQKGIIRHAFVGPDFTTGAAVETMLAALSD